MTQVVNCKYPITHGCNHRYLWGGVDPLEEFHCHVLLYWKPPSLPHFLSWCHTSSKLKTSPPGSPIPVRIWQTHGGHEKNRANDPPVFPPMFHSKLGARIKMMYENSGTIKYFVVYGFWSCAVLLLIFLVRKQYTFILNHSLCYRTRNILDSVPSRIFIRKFAIGCQKLCTH